jgi:hypothetical protein
MDPTTTWQRIVTGLQALTPCPQDAAQRAETVAALRDLATWLARGGFPPVLTTWPPLSAGPAAV